MNFNAKKINQGTLRDSDSLKNIRKKKVYIIGNVNPDYGETDCF